MVKMKDVASRANVSPATVSRVLNGADNVSPEIRERVNNAIRDLGYFPNNAARSLVRRQTGALAILLRNLHNPFFTDLIRGAEQAAQESNHNVIFCSLGNDRDYRDRYIQFLTNGMCDAAILYGTLFSDRPIIDHLLMVKFPFLLIENNFANLPVNQILINNFEGACMAVEHLVSNGHKRICHFMGDPNKQVHLERFNGYSHVMQKHGLFIGPNDIKNIYTNNDMAFDVAANMMTLPPVERPTAIFATNDRIAARAIEGIISQGCRVPQDISVVGFDNQCIYECGYNGPPITSIRQPLFEIGRDSVHIVTRILEGDIIPPYAKTYNAKLVELQTVCPPAAETP